MSGGAGPDGSPGNGLDGALALVTGATGTLGAAIARALAASGASLLLTGRDGAKLEALAESLAGAARVEILALDLAAADAPAVLGAALDRQGGGLDILVNNAAVQGPIGPLWENDEAAWEQAVLVDLFVPVRLIRLAVPRMAGRRRGKIVNISGGGATGSRPLFTAYAAAKTALVRITETLAAELADRAIDVNAIAPGAMRSALTDRILEAERGLAGTRELDIARKLAGGDDGATAARAAELVRWLAGPQSDGITGRLIAALWDPWPTLHERREALGASDIYTLRRIVPADRGLDWE